MDGTRSALIVASDDYEDPGLGRLRAPASDAEALAGVLRDPGIGDFEVRTLLNAPAHEVNLAVEEFFADRRPDDLLLLHFSGHGLKDEGGELYLAAANTRLRTLGATAVAAEFVNRRMSRSRSRRVVLLLDCCFAGAFERGMTARAGSGMGIDAHFGGRGRAVITASSAMEYAFEGDELTDSQALAPSVFTSALVEGLRTGEADRDQDGLVALDELYDYVYDKVREATPNQTPGKWTYGVQGELVIARRGRPVTTPTPLPSELQQAVEHPLASIRAAAVQELVPLLRGQHAGLALAARLTLERLTDDDSRRVAAAAKQALAAEAPQPVMGEVPAVAEVRAAEEAPSQAAAESAPAPLPVAQAAATASPPEAPAGGPEQADTPVAEPAAVAPEVEPAAVTPQAEPAAAPREAEPAAGGGEVAAPPDRLGRLAGQLAIAAAALLVVGVFPSYRYGTPLAGDSPEAVAPTLILAALAATAGACMLVARTARFVGPGLLLGAAPAALSGLLSQVSDAVLEDGFETGYKLLFVGGLALVLAACLAGVVLARSAEARVRGLPSEPLPWFVAALGAAGAVPLAMFASRVLDLTKGWVAAPVALMALMALVVPACVAVVAPRPFAVALLAGWIGGATTAAVYYFTAAVLELNKNGYDIGRGLIVVFGATLLALAVAAVLLARPAPAPPAARDAAG